MRMEMLKVKEPSAKNIVKARITAFSDADAEKAAALLSAGAWSHHTVKRISQVVHAKQKQPKLAVYYVLLWN